MRSGLGAHPSRRPSWRAIANGPAATGRWWPRPARA